MSPPRAVLMTIAPAGRRAKALASSRRVVASVRGTCRESTSLSARRSSKDRCAKGAPWVRWAQKATLAPRASRTGARRWAVAPQPTSPTRRPESSPRPSSSSGVRVQPWPRRIAASSWGSWRRVASISARACSATAGALLPGRLQTVMPRAAQVSRSMVFTPTPIFWIRRSFGAFSKKAASMG